MLPALLISCCWLAPAGMPDTPDRAREVGQLVRQLDDDQWARRQQAEDALLEMGPDILDQLPPDSARLSPEAERRLARVREQLQVKHARRATQASRVTLQGTMTLDEALGALQESTGNRITGYSRFSDRKINVQAQQIPFWEALDQVLDQANLSLHPYGAGEAGIRLVQRDGEGPDHVVAVDYTGMFRVQPTYVSATRDLLNPSIQGLRVRLSIAWEPRTTPISISLPLSTITARDDRGNAIQVDGSTGQLNPSVETKVSSVDIELPLELPSRQAHEIESLQGCFETMIPGRVETFEFNELDKGEPQRKRWAEVTVTLEEVRTNGNVKECRVHVAYDEAFSAFESHRGWILGNEAFLVNAAGERISSEGRRLLGKDEDSARTSFKFVLDQPLSGCKFVYRAPSLIVRENVRFALKNISLP
ncbi:MAG: hypothetical protein R6U98_18145 [Pirellulaceae bacterium]